jgi:hypothetical protein
MRKGNILMAIGAVAIVAGLVFGDSPHFKKAPTCGDNGLTASCIGSVSGLGNGDVQVTLAFPNATGSTTCTSPGGNTSPGQNPAVPAPVSGTAIFTNIKNGTLAFSVSTSAPANPSPAAAGCPNANWSAAFSDISFGTGTLTVSQKQADGTYVTVLSTTVTLP